MKTKQQKTQTLEQVIQPEAVTYTMERRRFIVSSAFQEDGHDSLGSILVRLMQSELNATLSLSDLIFKSMQRLF